VLGCEGGCEDDGDLHVYAFIDPTKPPAHRKVGFSRSVYWHMQPIWRRGNLYFTVENERPPAATKRMEVDVFRVPVEVTDTASIKIDAGPGTVHTLSRQDSSLRYPGVLVETNGVIIAWYMRYGLGGAKPTPEARYNVHYPEQGGLDFRDATTLRKGGDYPSDVEGFADIDLPGGAPDPSGTGFWISHAYSDAAEEGGSVAKLQVVGEVEPGCGSQNLCGGECVDLDTDHGDCGKCGHACAANMQCSDGVCEPPPCGGANLLSDPRNCGGCGRVCAGRCTLGHCCEPCRCAGGFTAGACELSAACEHICRAHEPH
jgi:hypothetical protein